MAPIVFPAAQQQESPEAAKPQEAAKPIRPWYAQGSSVLTRSEIQQRAREILESDEYKKSLSDRIKLGTLAPAIESMLWYYCWGRPAEQVTLTVTQAPEDLSGLSTKELLDRMRALANQLEEAEAMASAIPAEFKVAM